MEKRDKCINNLEAVLNHEDMDRVKSEFAKRGNSLDYAWIGKLKEPCYDCTFEKELEEGSFCTNQVLFAKMTHCQMRFKALPQEVYEKRAAVYEFINNVPLVPTKLGYVEIDMQCLMCPNSIPIDNLLYCGNSNLIELMEELNNGKN